MEYPYYPVEYPYYPVEYPYYPMEYPYYPVEYPYYPVEYPTWRCCDLRSGENPGETIPQSAYPKCPPLATGDWCTQQQQECCTPRVARPALT